MGNFAVPLIASVLGGAATSAAMKKTASKPTAVPTKISQPPTLISLGEQSKGYGDSQQMDLLSTIIAGRERKNKLG
tara:strand:- start:28 stop:255 length:228 start_codon:yes stop_codon:yes gene_type:complete